MLIHVSYLFSTFLYYGSSQHLSHMNWLWWMSIHYTFTHLYLCCWAILLLFIFGYIWFHVPVRFTIIAILFVARCLSGLVQYYICPFNIGHTYYPRNVWVFFINFDNLLIHYGMFIVGIFCIIFCVFSLYLCNGTYFCYSSLCWRTNFAHISLSYCMMPTLIFSLKQQKCFNTMS